MKLITLLKILDKVSYVIECLVIEANGEAKSVLPETIALVEVESDLTLTERDRILGYLRDACDAFRGEGAFREEGRNVRASAGILSGLSNELWQAVLKHPQLTSG